MARSRESDNYQPRNQYGIRKPLSVDEPTAEYRIIPVGFLDTRRLPRHSILDKKREIAAAIERYREMYGNKGEDTPKED